MSNSRPATPDEYASLLRELKQIGYNVQVARRYAAEQLRLDLCGAIYKDLEEEYSYRTADEQLAEDAEANDYTFDANGRRDG